MPEYSLQRPEFSRVSECEKRKARKKSFLHANSLLGCTGKPVTCQSPSREKYFARDITLRMHRQAGDLSISFNLGRRLCFLHGESHQLLSQPLLCLPAGKPATKYLLIGKPTTKYLLWHRQAGESSEWHAISFQKSLRMKKTKHLP